MTTLFLIYVSVLLLLALFVYATHDKIFYLNLFLIQRPFRLFFTVLFWPVSLIIFLIMFIFVFINLPSQ